MTDPGPRSVNPPAWDRPIGYANGMLAPAGSRLLVVAGQVGWDARQQLVSADLVEQFAQALRNVVEVVQAAGGRADHLIRLTYYVVDKEDYRRQTREIGAHYRQIVGRHFPASTLVEVAGLLEPGALVEIEATAALPPGDPDELA